MMIEKFISSWIIILKQKVPLNSIDLLQKCILVLIL